VGCKGMILKGNGFVAFFTGVKASSFCIHLSCLVCSLSVVRGEQSRLFCSHKGRNLPEVSIASIHHKVFKTTSSFHKIYIYFIKLNSLKHQQQKQHQQQIQITPKSSSKYSFYKNMYIYIYV
jgi:hypothetical protein